MTPQPAFALGATTSSFTPTRVDRAVSHRLPVRPRVQARPCTIVMQQKKGFFRNPFARDPEEAQPAYMEPQAGEPGSKPLAPVPKGYGMEKSEPKPTASAAEPAASDTKPKGIAQKLPVIGGPAQSVKRGLDLLREDILKNAPERAGVGRQDREAVTMKPMAGEPGYKPAAYQTVRVSQLGISTFSDDPNYVSKVGGVEAVKKAALDVKKGATAKEIKRRVLKAEVKEEPKTYDIPEYLKPLPEDTPRRGLTWKNYVGR